MNTETVPYPTYAKLIHLGLALFGIAAYATSEWAENGAASTGYLIHSYLGLSLAATMVIRIAMGLSPCKALTFKGWSPFSRQQWRLALADLRTLLSLKVPTRTNHQGIAGLVQAFGLIIFSWMALTGTAIFVFGPDIEYLEELHEIGENLIPLYLFLHVGAVILHSLLGKPIWRRML